MAPSKKRLFIGIAVQTPDGLPPLPGVHNALEKMAKFARVSDTYDDPILFFDTKDDPVTSDKIVSALTPKLLLDRPRINLYFCGHGAFMSGAEIWYLSNGNTSWRERIDVIAFREALATYGPNQISIFSDACQTSVHHPTKASTIIDEYAGAANRPEFDTFRATIKGEPAFATQTEGPLFTKALAEALNEPSLAIDELVKGAHNRNIVTSQSLKKHVLGALPDYAAEHGEAQFPEIMPAYVFDTNDYIEFDDHEYAVLEGGGFAGGVRGGAGAQPEISPATVATMRTRGASATAQAINSSVSEWRGHFWRVANDTARTVEPGSMLLRVVGHPAYTRNQTALFLADHNKTLMPRPHEERFQIFPASAVYAPVQPQRAAVLQVEDLYVPLGLGVSDKLSLIVNLFAVNDAPYHVDGAHVVGWRHADSNPTDTAAIDPMLALKGMLDGILGADTVAPIAASMRAMKHADPLFGIVAAYLYDRAGDIASIRRTCYYYRQVNQAIPIDIALLARLPLFHDKRGGFFIDVPAVDEDTIGKTNNLPHYAWRATPEGPGPPRLRPCTFSSHRLDPLEYAFATWL
jgi:hypothetical protein